ncbi:50s ribosomal protein l23, partial [Cystoisospora suis]
RNVFFPWQTFSLHRTGSFLERRRVALKVPVNLTKFEIKSYLEKIYNARILKVTTLIHVPRRRRDVYGPKPTEVLQSWVHIQEGNHHPREWRA